MAAMPVDRPKTVAQIRELLELPETANVGESLRRLQSTLALERGEFRLRTFTATSAHHTAVWWVERKKPEKTS